MGCITQQRWDQWRSRANDVLIWVLVQISEGSALRKKHDLWPFLYPILLLIVNYTSVAIGVADLHALSGSPSPCLSTLCECVGINIERMDIDMSVIVCVCVCASSIRVWGCVCQCTHIERPEQNVECRCVFVFYCLKMWSSIRLEIHHFGYIGQAISSFRSA